MVAGLAPCPEGHRVGLYLTPQPGCRSCFSAARSSGSCASHLVKLHFLELQICWQPGNLNSALRWASATCPLFCMLVQMDCTTWLTAVPWRFPKAPCCAVWSLDWGQYGVRRISPGEDCLRFPRAAQSNRCPQLPRRLLFAAIAHQALMVFLLEPGVQVTKTSSQTRSLLLLLWDLWSLSLHRGAC